MIIEMRRYAVLPGRMDDMHRRMSGMLLPLFAEHGIPRPTAIWDNRTHTSTLTWIVEWPDFETRQEAWARFFPVFVAARQAEGTPEFVTRTTLTLIAPWPGSSITYQPGSACETAWHVQPRIGFGAPFVQACLAETFQRFRSAGAMTVAGCNLVFGALPQAVVLLGWPDAAARDRGMARIGKDALGAPLDEALLGGGDAFAERGQWEALDRASYWRGPSTPMRAR